MKIYGIGSDIISNIRIKKSLKNKKFLKRIFTMEEIKKGSKLNILFEPIKMFLNILILRFKYF